ncbi:HNH endonuclease [Arcicella lustrica]|uniref:HNH endonuclease n=1 Tax=Arcicella lustrica TaxID=2984196 RepID=A0ABU5SGX7_9BACT|nr:hypothetical protein [Arcicella sp. DC25W]MEA5426556.1 hypothetical protein [Arcicella sp. DC25W]
MKGQKEKLIESINLYLRKNKLDNDTKIYSIEQWRERNEEHLNDSDFVIVSEGGLNFILNYGDSDEFDELIESFGYYMEMGHSWSYGFYFDGVTKENKNLGNINYFEKLKDERWILKRNKVRVKANFECQDCGNTSNLEVHHCYYKYGLEPWQYPIDALRCLCSKCHEERGIVEMELRARMADLKTQDLKIISELLYGGINYYPQNKVLDLIQYLKLSIDALKTEQQ